MIYLKILGGIFVALSGVMISFTLNKSVSVALRVAEGWERLLIQIKNEIECFSLPIGEILRRVEPSLLCQCGYTADNRPEDLSELLEGTLITDRETARIVTRFVSEFGRCYKSEQVGRCAYFAALMEERRKKLAEELPVRRKLNATLCVAASLGLVILFM